MYSCRVCNGPVREVIDLGRQPSANRFVLPEEVEGELFLRLAVGMCEDCTMVQLLEDMPQEVRYHDTYRYHASGSASHRKHFEQVARRFLEGELAKDDPFIVEIGCNDGVMLETIAQAGVRHLGVDPAKDVAALAEAKGVRVRTTFFDEPAAVEIRAEHGPADVIFGANTICHVAYQESLLRGVDALLSEDGIYAFEEPYLDTIVGRMAFDQIYDEHIYYFTARSVKAMAERFGFELVDVEELALHGGEVRYVLARPGRRQPTRAVAEMLARESALGLAEPARFERWAAAVTRVRSDLVELLGDIRAQGKTVVGYGSPAKTSTVTNYCKIGTELLPFVVDSTPAKQGRLVPGSHIPVRSPEAFADTRPDYAVLFAWNHAEEIMAKEKEFRDRGGRWILYVPEVRLL
jgi:SAM-dependent methyltransferase